MTPVQIRPEVPEDAAAIRSCIQTAFAPVGYSSQTEAAIVAALRAAGALAVSLVAVRDGGVVGHIAFSPVKIGGDNIQWYGLGPVSVVPELQGRGIGSGLIREGLRRLAEGGAAGCVVLGELEYYGRFGFENDSALHYDAAPAPYFMRLVLQGPPAAGSVAYHEAFDATEDGEGR